MLPEVGRAADGGAEDRTLTSVLLGVSDHGDVTHRSATVMARGNDESATLSCGSCSFPHVKGVARTKAQRRHLQLLEAMAEGSSRNATAAPPPERWYEISFDRPRGSDLGLIVEFSTQHKALVVLGTIKDSIAYAWQNRLEGQCALKLQMGDQIVRVNGVNTAHDTGSFHPRLRFIMAHDNDFTFQVRRGYELHHSPLMNVYENSEDIPDDGSTFVLSRQAVFPIALGVTPRMIQHYSQCYAVSREIAEIELRGLDEMEKVSWTVPNYVIYEYEF